MRQVRSAKGVLVDFDLLAIKQQIGSGPTPQDVSSRERFIDQRARRRRPAPETQPDLPVETEKPETASEEDVTLQPKRRKITSTEKTTTGEN